MAIRKIALLAGKPATGKVSQKTLTEYQNQIRIIRRKLAAAKSVLFTAWLEPIQVEPRRKKLRGKRKLRNAV